MIDHIRIFIGMKQEFCLFLFYTSSRYLETVPLEDLINSDKFKCCLRSLLI